MADYKANPATALRNLALAMPQRPAMVYPDVTFSYRQLISLAEAFALRLRAIGVGKTSIVHLNSRDSAVVVPTIFATALLGARFLQNVGSLDQPNLPAVTHALRAAGTDGKSDDHIVDESWSPAALRTQGLVWNPEDDSTDADEPWLVVFTSGTTGLPKFVTLSHQQVTGRSHAVADEFRTGETRFASLFPADSRPFIARIFAALLNGSTYIAGDDPTFWLKNGVNRVASSLGQARARLTDVILTSKIPVIEVAGAAVSDSDAALLLRSFDLVDDTYGATETNKTFSNLKTVVANGGIHTIGRLRDSKIEIRRPDGSLCQPLEEGEIRIQNEYLAAGYLEAPEATAQAFRDGWFYPGDRGLWGAEDVLIVVPRQGEFINADGAKIGLAAIDQVLASVNGILEAACFPSPKPEARGELLAIAVFAENVNQAQVVARARKLCSDLLGQSLTPRVIHRTQRLPRLASGLPDRAKCAEQILEASRAAKGITAFET